MQKQRKSLLFITNIPSPYRIDFFNELGKYCELTVLFEKQSSSERDQRWNNFKVKHFNAVFLNGFNVDVDKAVAFDVIHYIKSGSYDEIIVSNIATPTGMIAIQYMKLHRIDYWVEGDGAFPKKEKFIKHALKKYLIGGAKGCFSTAIMHDEYYKQYVSDYSKLYRYPFSSLFDCDIYLEPAEDEEKQRLREKYDIRESKVIVSIGRIVHGKGFDVLIQAMCGMQDNYGAYIIGGQPTEELIRLIKQNNIQNVHFVDFQEKKIICEYLRLADLFVLPTRSDVWGLVVNEAMSAGVPVITSDKCVAGLELVENGQNGYIVPVEDNQQLAEKIKAILSDDVLQKKMCKSSLQRIRNYTIENMALRHIEVLFGEKL